MASITLPTNPSDGDTFSNDGTTFIYSSSKGKWRIKKNVTAQSVNVDSNVNLASLTASIVPSTANTYDLGSALKPWRELYLSSNSLNIGDAVVSADGTDIQLPENSRIGTFVKELAGDAPFPDGDYGDLTTAAAPALNLLSSSENSESSSTTFNCETTPTGRMAPINLGNLS